MIYEFEGTTLPSHLEPKLISQIDLIKQYYLKAGLETEIKMNIDINFGITEIRVLNIESNFGITEIQVLNIDINFGIPKFRF